MTNNYFFPSFQSASKKTSGAYTTGSSDPAVSPGRVAGGERGGGEGGGERGGGGREEGKKKEEEGEERLRLTSELQEIERERLAQPFQLIMLGYPQQGANFSSFTVSIQYYSQFHRRMYGICIIIVATHSKEAL